MKLLFLTEYFPPFVIGGSEWSTFYLAYELVNQYNIEVFVLTPNYGKVPFQIIDNIQVLRYPNKGYNEDERLFKGRTSFFFTNPISIVKTAFKIYSVSKKLNIDIIHIHGKFFIPAVMIANLFLKKKIVATIRDYQIICNYGFCLYENDRACSLWDYYRHDFYFYIRKYIKKINLWSLLLNFIFSVWGRFTVALIKGLAIHLPIILLSKKQEEIFKKNGFLNTHTIYNSITFPLKLAREVKENYIVYAGRLTYGKGAEMLLEIIPIIIEKYQNITVYIVGEGLLKEQFVKLSEKYPKNVKILGKIEHEQLLKLFARAKLTIVPSLWHEPFGRVALESIMSGTPVLATRKGGLPEIVKDGYWGEIVNPTIDEIIEGIDHLIKNNKKYTKQIYEDYTRIKEKFGSNTTKSYIEIYRKLINE